MADNVTWVTLYDYENNKIHTCPKCKSVSYFYNAFTPSNTNSCPVDERWVHELCRLKMYINFNKINTFCTRHVHTHAPKPGVMFGP